jgi:uncharacterized protein YukE
MSLPSNYDAVTLYARPSAMASIAQRIVDEATAVTDDLTLIGNTLSDLALAWTGDSAQVAEDFTTRWQQAMTTLFGTTDDPDSGIVNILASGLDAAAQNFSGCEQQVVTMFSAFTDPAPATVTATGTDGDTEPGIPPAVIDQVTDTYYHTTSVDETF